LLSTGIKEAALYGWLWHLLPGGTAVKAAAMTAIILAATAALWFFVFPWASIHLPIDSSGFGG
jgi:hypothetical protein